MVLTPSCLPSPFISQDEVLSCDPYQGNTVYQTQGKTETQESSDAVVFSRHTQRKGPFRLMECKGQEMQHELVMRVPGILVKMGHSCDRGLLPSSPVALGTCPIQPANKTGTDLYTFLFFLSFTKEFINYFYSLPTHAQFKCMCIYKHYCTKFSITMTLRLH